MNSNDCTRFDAAVRRGDLEGRAIDRCAAERASTIGAPCCLPARSGAGETDGDAAETAGWRRPSVCGRVTGRPPSQIANTMTAATVSAPSQRLNEFESRDGAGATGRRAANAA
jgi:hypothetical protein